MEYQLLKIMLGATSSLMQRCASSIFSSFMNSHQRFMATLASDHREASSG